MKILNYAILYSANSGRRKFVNIYLSKFNLPFKFHSAKSDLKGSTHVKLCSVIPWPTIAKSHIPFLKFHLKS